MQMHKHDAPCPKPTAAFILHQLGIDAYNRENIEAALRFMSMACAQREAPVECHRNYAEILHRCGRLDEAEAAARRAVRRDPNSADAWDTLGTILVDRGAFAESRDCYQTAVQIRPDFLAALNNLAVVLHVLGKFEASEACYRQALKLQSDNLEVQLNFAIFLGELKRYREAVEVAERILPCYPKNSQLHYAMRHWHANAIQCGHSPAGRRGGADGQRQKKSNAEASRPTSS
jgi:protein O-GlcNAc transferase